MPFKANSLHRLVYLLGAGDEWENALLALDFNFAEPLYEKTRVSYYTLTSTHNR